MPGRRDADRITELRGMVVTLMSITTHLYIALKSLPPETQRHDPDFNIAVAAASKELDELYQLLKDYFSKEGTA